MRHLINSLLAAMMILIAAACQKDEIVDPVIVQLGSPFNIAFNQEASVKDENLVLKFAEIKEDSRCPDDVVCVWEGRLVISIQANNQPVELSIGGDSEPVSEIGAYRITLVEVVAPTPKSCADINHSDYMVALTIEKIPG